MTFRFYKKGETIHKFNHIYNEMHIILDGEVSFTTYLHRHSLQDKHVEQVINDMYLPKAETLYRYQAFKIDIMRMDEIAQLEQAKEIIERKNLIPSARKAAEAAKQQADEDQEANCPNATDKIKDGLRDLMKEQIGYQLFKESQKKKSFNSFKQSIRPKFSQQSKLI